MSLSGEAFEGYELSMTAPATQPQQEIWMAMQLGGPEASLAYNECTSLEISGPIDPERLRSAWELVAERHESLRTCFTLDGQTLCIEKVPRVDWRQMDWSRMDPDEKREKRAALLEAEVDTPFDLVSSPGFRVFWLDYGKDSSEFVLTGHHLVCDGYSTGVLLTELCQAYAAISDGKIDAMAPAPRFSDYALTQKETLNGPELAEAERHWLKVLGESPETLDLPTDLVRPPQRSFEAKREDFHLPKDLLDGLKSMAGKTGVSLSAAFFAALNCFLHRLSGQTEFVIGMPAAGQTLPGFGGLVGHCVNTLPLPVRVDPEQSYADQAKRAKSAILDGLENQILSFGNLLQKLRIPRDASRIPLIPVLFNLDPPIRLGLLGEAKIRAISHPRRYEAFELFLNGTEKVDGLVIEATYNTSLFAPGTIGRWMADFQELLRSVVQNPAQRVIDLPVLSAGSKALLEKWNQNARPLPAGATALSLFEAQVARTPDALAVRDSWTGCTYRELDGRANLLARRLLELGVASEDLVGVSLSRDIQMLAALLAVWKTGAAYLPLDPDFPEDRLDFIAKDSGIKTLITESELLGLSKAEGIKNLLVDKEKGSAESGPGRNGGPETLAYVLYTSGSTGKPKGVQIEHGSLLNFLSSMSSDLSMSARDIMVSVTTLSFDIAGLELFLPLVNGAQTVIATREDALDGQRLSRLLGACSATALQATPATWQLLVETDWKAGPGFKALCGGEALPQELAKKLLERVPTLWNLYGPTETTIWSTFEKLTSIDAAISIGRPIGNTTLHIVDSRLQSVPIGSPGELLIGGLGVARGYLNRPDLTREKFLPDSSSTKPGARVYRTGDICRFGPDGKVYFQRRNDSQVKVRGFRIELGEIESAIAAVEGIVVSVATVKEFSPGDTRLIGYYVGREGIEVDQAKLKAELARRLPNYMVPQHLVPLPRLPMTPNGKIDRKALPLPSGEVSTSRDHVEAVTPVQLQIAAIWTELLRINRISITDSFFDLGGHSILASRMLSRIRENLGVEIPMRAVFQAQTIESLALKVEAVLLAMPRAAARSGPVETFDF